MTNEPVVVFRSLLALLWLGLVGISPMAAAAVMNDGNAMPKSSQPLPAPVQHSASAMFERLAKMGTVPAQALVVAVSSQRLYLFEDGQLIGNYPVSTAERGTGNQEGSLQTPLGLHRVAEKIGAEAPSGMIFRGRQPTGQRAEILTLPEARAERDDVTSRILWLDGLEPGINRGGNVDSKRRYIYIHGTPEEGRIGSPASHGCVRMSNADVIELFDRVEVDALVDIIE